MEQTRENFIKRMEDKEGLRDKRFNYFLNKRRTVNNHKDQLNQIRQEYREHIQNRDMELTERNMLIRRNHELGQKRRQEFLMQKREMAL